MGNVEVEDRFDASLMLPGRGRYPIGTGALEDGSGRSLRGPTCSLLGNNLWCGNTITASTSGVRIYITPFVRSLHPFDRGF